MTNALLSWGSAFLAFGPIASLIFLIVYQKSQLVIVVTTSAFAFLISALGASLVWFIFHAMNLNHPLIILIPGIVSQGIMRCAFVWMYHRVEKVIQISIARHEQQTHGNEGDELITESAKLRLELNDWACGLAAGAGFGGMHVVLLYGTLLASETGNLGTLVQDSCPRIPGLLQSALHAFCFSILDIIWMLFTFFGMRRRRESEAEISTSIGSLFGNSERSGNFALFIICVSHAAASLATLPNGFEGGCYVSIPLLVSIVLITTAAFVFGISKVYLPDNQRRRITGYNE
jgi:Aph-1 protein